MEWPLTAMAFIFLAAYAIPIAFPDVDPWVVNACAVTLALSWLVFIVDYLVRLGLAENKWGFVKTHWFDLAVLVLPVLRPLRLMRVFTLLTVLQKTGSSRLRGRVVAYTAGATLLLLTVGALAITQAERGHEGANIRNVGDGLWWALTTVTTVRVWGHVPRHGAGALRRGDGDGRRCRAAGDRVSHHRFVAGRQGF